MARVLVTIWVAYFGCHLIVEPVRSCEPCNLPRSLSIHTGRGGLVDDGAPITSLPHSRWLSTIQRPKHCFSWERRTGEVAGSSPVSFRH